MRKLDTCLYISQVVYIEYIGFKMVYFSFSARIKWESQFPAQSFWSRKTDFTVNMPCYDWNR